MTITLRTATVADAAAITELTHQLGYARPAAGVAASLARILERGDQRFLVADSEGRTVGWIHVVVADSVDLEPFAMIAGLGVDRTCRRRGSGQQLLASAEAWAAEQGCSMVRLTSSSARNAAHRFYESAGYTNVKTQYSFAKPVGGTEAGALAGLVPKVDV